MIFANRRRFQHPLPPIKLPALSVPDVDETEDEHGVLLEDRAPPPLAVEAAPPLFDVVVLVPPDDGALEDCAGAAALPLCGDEESVRVGVLSGSVPQEEDVVTPPVALGDTEQGIPRRLSAGSVDAVPAAGAAFGEVRFDEGTPGESVPPDAPLPELLSWAWAGANATHPTATARMKRRLIALSIS